MGLDHTLVGVPSEPQERSWDSKDALLYAVGVGAGLGDPLQELEFTTENCEGIRAEGAADVRRADSRRPGPGRHPRRLRPGPAWLHAEQAFETAPAAAGRGDRAPTTADGDRHLRQGVRGRWW